MNKHDNYQPVSCAVHSEYELAIMHRQKLTLTWQEGDQQLTATVLPLDLVTERHAEFLLAEDQSGQTLRIRLDQISMKTTG